MEKRRLGKTDMDISVLGFGGSEIGYERASSATVKKLLNQALDAGLNVIDTAECYVTSEELIGAAVGARRGDFYLFTKCGHERGWDQPDWRPESLLRSIERSLKRLNTDYVDLVQLHSCSEVELGEGGVIDALKRARERGHTRYIGYSGDSAAALYAVECGEFDTLQISVSVADQEALERILGIIRKSIDRRARSCILRAYQLTWPPHMTLDPLAALALFLPDKALAHFDITDAALEGGEIHLTLVEKDVPPKHEGTSPPRFHSYRELMVSDFPIRGKAAVLTFKRRYWKVEDQKELLTNDIPLVFPGTKLESAFADFLKGAGRNPTDVLGEYRDFKPTGDQGI